MIWDDVMDYGRYCGLIGYQKVLALYLSSIGCHIGNFHNKGGTSIKPPFYTVKGQIPDIRSHIFSVGPPGYGKSLYERFFVEERLGLLIGAIPCVRQGGLTAKGLTGGWEDDIRVVGEAERYRDGVICIEEFDHVIKAGLKEHSNSIGNDLLDLLDSGHYRNKKGTKEEAIEYDSYFTLFAGTQPERFQVGTGLARRVMFLDQIPDDSIRKALFQSHYSGVGIQPNMSVIRSIREKIGYLFQTFAATEIELTQEYQDMAMKIGATHLELQYLDKFAIGYRIIRHYKGGKKLIVEPDPDLHDLLKMVKQMRMGCMFGAVELQILKLLEKPRELTAFKLLTVQELHMNYKSVTEAVRGLMDDGAVEIIKVPKEGVKKPVSVLRRRFVI
jgi:hypothetical protein